MRVNATEYLFSVNTRTPPTMAVGSGEEFTIEVRDTSVAIYIACAREGLTSGI
jgi:hypothetical protein